MRMDGWEDYLHFSFQGEHVLVQSLPLNSFLHFFWAALLTTALCLTERLLTFALARQWTPFQYIRRSRIQSAMWRSALYWMVTLNRLIYMLIAMSYHVGLILVIVTALAVGQFFIEYLDTPKPESRDSYRVREPLLKSPSSSRNSISTRPRSRSKPEGIFIHPKQSNLARADAVALEMGITGDTERVKGNTYPEDEDAWEVGKGRDVARELLGPSLRRDSSRHVFHVADDDEDNSERDSS